MADGPEDLVDRRWPKLAGNLDSPVQIDWAWIEDERGMDHGIASDGVIESTLDCEWWP